MRQLQCARAQVENRTFIYMPGNETLARRVKRELVGEQGFRNLSSIRMVNEQTVLLGNFGDFKFLLLLSASNCFTHAKLHSFQRRVLNGIEPRRSGRAKNHTDLMGGRI